MDEIPNERLSLPSASSFAIDAACEGRQNLMRAIPESEHVRIESDDEQAARGTRIHHALETDDVSNLSEDEMDDWATAKGYLLDVVGNWKRDNNIEDSYAVECHRENRLWLTDSNGNYVLSGKPDVAYICVSKSVALIVDLKSGFSTNLAPSQRNWQLKVLAVLGYVNFPVDSVRVSFIKPKSRYSPTDTTDYSAKDLARATIQIHSVLERSRNPDANRTAGSHCRWCLVRHKCVEAGAYALLPSVVAGVGSTLPAKKDVESMVGRLSPQDWKFIWERGSVIRNILGATTACLGKLSSDDLAALGLKMTPGRRLDPIVDVIGAYKALEHALPAKALWECLSLSKGDLVEKMKEHRNVSKKEAERMVRELLGPFIEEKRAADGLEEVES